MDRITGLRVFACVMPLLCAPALAADVAAWSGERAGSAKLVENSEPELCGRVLDAARKWFGSSSIDSSGLLDSALNAHPVPRIEPRPEAPLGYQRLDVDLDGDGRNEILIITSSFFRDQEILDGFVVRQESAIAGLLKAMNDGGSGSHGDLPGGVVEWGPRDDSLDGSWTTRFDVLFEWHGRYYLSDVMQRESTRADVALHRLDANGKRTLTCRVASDDPADVTDKLKARREIGAFLTARAHLGTSGSTNCGTSGSGWRADQIAQSAVTLAAVRPWAMIPEAVPDADDEKESQVLWRFLEEWSKGDAWSRREYLVFLESLEPARRAYAGYLQAQFKLDAPTARRHAASIIDALVALRFDIPASFVEQGYVDWYFGRDDVARMRNDPRYANEFGKTGLMMAAHMNRIDVVRELLAKGADPNALTRQHMRCGYGVRRASRTALMYAAENASPMVMKVLLEAGAKAGVTDSEHNSVHDYQGWNPRLTDEQKNMPISTLAAGSGQLADSPGFDCRRAASRAEKAICGSEALRLLDAEMTTAYLQAVAADPALRSDQRLWAGRRAQGCADKQAREYTDCLADATAARERYLQYLVAP